MADRRAKPRYIHLFICFLVVLFASYRLAEACDRYPSSVPEWRATTEDAFKILQAQEDKLLDPASANKIVLWPKEWLTAVRPDHEVVEAEKLRDPAAVAAAESCRKALIVGVSLILDAQRGEWSLGNKHDDESARIYIQNAMDCENALNIPHPVNKFRTRILHTKNIDEPNDNIPDRFRNWVELINKGDCDKAWVELWRIASSKDYYALYLVAGSLVSHPFKFEGLTPDQMGEIFLPAAVYGTLSTEVNNQAPFSLDVLRALIPTIIRESHKKEDNVIACFSSQEKSERCVELAINSHLIPKYKNYIDGVERINKVINVRCSNSFGDNLNK